MLEYQKFHTKFGGLYGIPKKFHNSRMVYNVPYKIRVTVELYGCKSKFAGKIWKRAVNYTEGHPLLLICTEYIKIAPISAASVLIRLRNVLSSVYLSSLLWSSSRRFVFRYLFCNCFGLQTPSTCISFLCASLLLWDVLVPRRHTDEWRYCECRLTF